MATVANKDGTQGAEPHVLTPGSQRLAFGGESLALGAVTIETVMALIRVPANALGPNGALRGEYISRVTNNAGAKMVRVRLGGLTGTVLHSLSHASIASARVEFVIWNRNDIDLQASFQGGAGSGTTSLAIGAGAINTTVDQDLAITFESATGSDMWLEKYKVDLER